MANVVHNLKVNGSTYPVGTVHYIAGTGTTAGTWLGTDNSITEYFDGLTIAYKIPIDGASTTTLNINGLGAKTVRRNTNNLTTHLPVNTVVILTYTTISGTGYWVWADYNSDNDTKVTQTAPSASSYNNWRPLVIGSSNNSTEGFTPSTVTDSTYTFSTITAQPSSGTIRATTFKGNLSGNSGTATKLATARSIALGTGATGTATKFDGSANITIPVTSVKESYLDWGGKNISGSVSPVGASLSSEHSANRLAYLNPNALSFEYSDNGGSTWSTLSVSNDTKIGFVTTSGSFTVGTATPVTTNHRSRVTITAQNGTTGYVYTRPRKLLLNVNTSGHGLSVLIETKTGVTNASWNTVGTYALSGWSGWNDIPLSFTTLGGGKYQTSNIWYMRLTFAITSVSSSYSNSRASIIGMRLFGDTCWTKTSNMGETGHLYSYDTAQNATFPAKVTATGFSGPLTGNATTASGIKDSANSSTITASYASAQLAYSDITHLACWNGYQLRAVNKSVFAASDHTHSVATTSAPGFMSKDDKSKLDGITASADSVSFSASAASGNKVGTITINGTATDMYSPTQTTVSGNAGSATKLATARTIDGMSFNGTANIAHYGTCSTAAATAAKVVSLTGFTLDTGARIVVKFTVTNTAASPTLNVNSTGAKAIYYRGSAITAGYLAANRTYEFVYNGTQWDLVGDINTDSDSRVLQTATTSNASYPLLLAPSGQTSTVTTTSYFDSGVTLNPSTNTIAANVSGSAGSVAWGNVSSKPSYYDAKAIKSITRSGATFTYTCLDDTTGTFTQQDNNTAHSHSVGTGLTVSGSGGTSGTTTYSANLNSTTSLGTIGTTSKLYAVGVDANGKLCVNVPWTDTNTVYTHPSYTAHSSGLYKITVDSKGHVSEATAVTKEDITNLGIPSTNTTYSTAKYNTSGLVKPAYTSTGAATLTTAAASNTTTPTIAAKTTTSGRYYAVEADKNGVLFVNVPWTYTDTKVTNNTTTSKYYLTGSTSNSNTTGTLVKRSTVYVDTSGNLVANNIPSTGLIWQSF